MKNVKFRLGAGITIFILFFGVSIFEAIRTKNWGAVCFWLVLAVLFLLLDNVTKMEKE
jgi:hypothetical protein